MSSNEEAQTKSTISDRINPSSKRNPPPNNMRMSIEVNKKIFELIAERHANDLKEGKDENDTKIRNKSFLDRLKKRGKGDKQSGEIKK